MTNRVILGQTGATTFGLKVSKAGKDVLTAGAGDLLFDSEAPSFHRIVIRGVTNWPNDNSSQSVTVFYPQVLSARPSFFGCVLFNGHFGGQCIGLPETWAGTLSGQQFAQVDVLLLTDRMVLSRNNRAMIGNVGFIVYTEPS